MANLAEVLTQYFCDFLSLELHFLRCELDTWRIVQAACSIAEPLLLSTLTQPYAWSSCGRHDIICWWLISFTHLFLPDKEHGWIGLHHCCVVHLNVVADPSFRHFAPDRLAFALRVQNTLFYLFKVSLYDLYWHCGCVRVVFEIIPYHNFFRVLGLLIQCFNCTGLILSLYISFRLLIIWLLLHEWMWALLTFHHFRLHSSSGTRINRTLDFRLLWHRLTLSSTPPNLLNILEAHRQAPLPLLSLLRLHNLTHQTRVHQHMLLSLLLCAFHFFLLPPLHLFRYGLLRQTLTLH